jgi:hypothetical protein
MQYQVTNTVRLGIRTPPDLFIRQLFEATFNFRQVLANKKIYSPVQEGLGKSMLFRR